MNDNPNMEPECERNYTYTHSRDMSFTYYKTILLLLWMCRHCRQCVTHCNHKHKKKHTFISFFKSSVGALLCLRNFWFCHHSFVSSQYEVWCTKIIIIENHLSCHIKILYSNFSIVMLLSVALWCWCTIFISIFIFLHSFRYITMKQMKCSMWLYTYKFGISIQSSTRVMRFCMCA